MPRQFNLDDFLFFLQAFDKLGLTLYGEDWTGKEAWAAPNVKTNSELKDRQAIEEEILDLTSKRMKLSNRLQYLSDEADRCELDQEITKTLNQINTLRDRLGNLPEYGDAHIQDAALFKRRKETEDILIQALLDQKIQAHFGFSFLIEWRAWSREKGFKYFLPLSMAVAGPKQSARRRAPLLIEKAGFDAWLYNEIAPDRQTEAIQSPQELCEALIRQVTKGPWLPKEQIKKQAMDQITNLSQRAFERAWSAAAPERWKKSGRRHS